MTRKEFIADVQAAREREIKHISNIARGDDDGDVNFCYLPPSGHPVEIGVLATGMAVGCVALVWSFLVSFITF